MKKIYDWFKSLSYNNKNLLKGVIGIVLIYGYVFVIYMIIFKSVSDIYFTRFSKVIAVILIVDYMYSVYKLITKYKDSPWGKIRKVDFKKNNFIVYEESLYMYVGDERRVKQENENKEKDIKNYRKLEKTKYIAQFFRSVDSLQVFLLIFILIFIIFILMILEIPILTSLSVVVLGVALILVSLFGISSRAVKINNKEIDNKIKEIVDKDKGGENEKETFFLNVLGYNNYVSDKFFSNDDTFKKDIIRKIEYNKIPILLNGEFGTGKSYFVDNELSKLYNIKKIELHKSGYKNNLFYYVFKKLNIKRNIFETLTDNIIAIVNNPTLLKYYLVMLIPMFLYVISAGKNSSEVTTNYEIIIIFIAVILPLIITILLPYFLVNESDFSIYYRDIYLRNIKTSINPIQDLIVFEDIDRIDENAFYELESIVNFMLGENIKIILLGDYELIKKYSKYDGKENYFEKFFEIYDLEVPKEKFVDVLIDNLPLFFGKDYLNKKFEIEIQSVAEEIAKEYTEKITKEYTEKIEKHLTGKKIKKSDKKLIERSIKTLVKKEISKEEIKNIIEKYNAREIIRFCEYEDTTFVNSSLKESLENYYNEIQNKNQQNQYIDKRSKKRDKKHKKKNLVQRYKKGKKNIK